MSPEAILAYYCGDAEMQCVTSPIEFEKSIDLASWLPDWDTDWIPSGSDVQVRFILQIPANTQVKLGGKFQATWPDAMTIVTPGDRLSGFLKFDYGLVVHGWARIDTDILGYNISWQGDIPYVPQIDFHLLGMQAFDSWAFPPNSAEASATTSKARLFHVNLLGLTGIPSEVAEGGVDLAIAGELKVTYQTNKMQITPSVVPITTETGATLDNFVGGSFVEYDVHPEGTVTYDGIIHLYPEIYVKILTSEFNIQIADWPISLSEIVGQTFKQDIVFDNVKVHVPLPDITPLQQTVYDYGKVAIGSGEKLTIPVANWGEARAQVVGQVDESMKSVFDVMTSSLLIDPCASDDIKVRFKPKKAGKFETTLTIMSNDPDTPTQQVLLKGEAVDDEYVDPDGGEAGGSPSGGDDDGGVFGAAPGSGQDGGCGCRMAESDAGTAGVLAALGLVALAASRRRSRAGRKCD